MTPKKQKEVSKLLKSGNFTIMYHDNGFCELYEGHHEYGEVPENLDRVCSFEGQCGYIPLEVDALVEALGGKAESV